MTSKAQDTTTGRGSRWTIALWGAAALLLLTPLVAMQFTAEVDWDGFDFLVIGVMLATVCGIVELVVRMTDNLAYRAAIGVALAAGFLSLWINMAVGIIGDENEAANLWFVAVLAVPAIGAALALFKAGGMSRAMLATAIAQALVGGYALYLGSYEGTILSGFFVALWLLSARLFGKAAQDQRTGRDATA